MKEVNYKKFYEQIDVVSGYQIIKLEDFEINAYIIQPRINNSRFSYANKICKKSNKRGD